MKTTADTHPPDTPSMPPPDPPGLPPGSPHQPGPPLTPDEQGKLHDLRTKPPPLTEAEQHELDALTAKESAHAGFYPPDPLPAPTPESEIKAVLELVVAGFQALYDTLPQTGAVLPIIRAMKAALAPKPKT